MYVCMHFCMSACAAMYIVCIPPPVQLNLAMDPRLSGWGKDSLRVSVVVKKLFHCFFVVFYSRMDRGHESYIRYRTRVTYFFLRN